MQRIEFGHDFKMTYVGNAAHAHIVAKNCLRQSSDCAGEVYYITDDTPLEELFTAIKPYVEARGQIRMSDWSIPYIFAILAMSIIALILRLIRPIYQVRITRMDVLFQIMCI